MKNTVVIGLGSNIDPEKNIETARKLLSRQFRVVAESAFVRTEPIGYKDQQDFINGSILLETDLSCEALKQRLKALEKQMGREASSIKHGPRSIDMDIVVFNGKVTDKDFYDREFLKKAVLELVPDLDY